VPETRLSVSKSAELWILLARATSLGVGSTSDQLGSIRRRHAFLDTRTAVIGTRFDVNCSDFGPVGNCLLDCR
jgi:hypothetical protein